MHQRLLIVAASWLISGCSLMYHEADDKTAQEAKAAFATTKPMWNLATERDQVLAQQGERRALLVRGQQALRDQLLAATLNGTDEGGWGFLLKRVNEAMPARVVGSDCPAPSLLLRQVSEAQQNVHKYKLVIGLALGQAAPVEACAAQPAPAPELVQSNGNASAAYVDYQRYCKEVKRLNQCVNQIIPSADHQTLVEARDAADALDQAIAQAVEEYTRALKAAEATPTEPGAAARVASDLRTKLDSLGNKTLSGNTGNNPLLRHLNASATIAAIHQERALLDSYFDLLDGTGKPSAAVSQVRTSLVANLVNRSTEQHVPVMSLVLRSEQLGIENDAARARLAHARHAIDLMERKEQLLLRERAELDRVRLARDGATREHCTQRALAEALSADHGGCRRFAAEALEHYALAWTLGHTPAELIQNQLQDEQEMVTLEESETALKKTEQVTSTGLEVLTRAYQSGVKPEQVASLWQAFWISVIGVK